MLSKTHNKLLKYCGKFILTIVYFMIGMLLQRMEIFILRFFKIHKVKHKEGNQHKVSYS